MALLSSNAHRAPVLQRFDKSNGQTVTSSHRGSTYFQKTWNDYGKMLILKSDKNDGGGKVDIWRENWQTRVIRGGWCSAGSHDGLIWVTGMLQVLNEDNVFVRTWPDGVNFYQMVYFRSLSVIMTENEVNFPLSTKQCGVSISEENFSITKTTDWKLVDMEIIYKRGTFLL